MEIDRRRFLALAASVMAVNGCTNRADRRLPNFIVIITDDQGYQDLGCYGSPDIATPRLDAMAAEGVRFTDFYAAAPVCTPSRAALMTGCYPMRVGLPQVLGPQSRIGIAEEEITLAELLKTAGYATACIGKWHLGHHQSFLPLRHGFDYFFGIPYSNDMDRQPGHPPIPLMRGGEIIEQPVVQETLTERYTQEAIDFIRRNREKPFFLYLAHTMPHVPLSVSPRFRGKSKRGLYGDVIECIDWGVGQILDSVRDLDLEKDTLVVFTSDNGPWLVKGDHAGSALPLRGGKATTWEGGMRVPCLARWPGKIKAGSVCSQLCTNMDFYPTLAGLAGISLPTDRIIDGKDMWPLMSSPETAESAYEAFFYYRVERLEAVRSGVWKLMLPRLPEPGRQETATGALLYNLGTDIGETHDCSQEHPDIVRRLSEMAEKCREDLGDRYYNRQGKNCRPPGSLPENELD